MQPFPIIINTGFRLTLMKMSGEINGFRIREISSLIIPDFFGITGAVDKD